MKLVYWKIPLKKSTELFTITAEAYKAVELSILIQS